MVQPNRVKLDGRELRGDPASDGARLAVRRPATIDSDMGFELDRVEPHCELTDGRAEQPTKRLARREPQGEFRVSWHDYFTPRPIEEGVRFTRLFVYPCCIVEQDG